MNSNDKLIKNLIDALPEVYQPIYGYDISYETSRECLDRLEHIKNISLMLKKTLNRELNVLDLGCAQGFFSFSLAQAGAKVIGVDFCKENVALCNHIKLKNTALDVQFVHGNIKDVISTLDLSQFDLVLGLSVFHHIIHYQGLKTAQDIIRKLSQIDVGIFELALNSEPVYWANSLPSDELALLNNYEFTFTLSKFYTHLSGVDRPLVFSSNKFITDGKVFSQYNEVIKNNNRKIYLTDESVFKYSQKKDLNAEMEYNNEVCFLKNNYTSFPRLLSFGSDEKELWLIREYQKGNTIEFYIKNKIQFNRNSVLSQVLDQLIFLESKGLYHNDLRTWNVLYDSHTDTSVLIDFGAISISEEDCIHPKNIFLSFFSFVRELFSGELTGRDWERVSYITPQCVSDSYINLFLDVMALPSKELSFLKIKMILDSLDSDERDESVASAMLVEVSQELQVERNNIYKHLSKINKNEIDRLNEVNSIELNKLSSINNELESKMLDAIERYQQLQENYEKTVQSKSWKLTVFLRKGAFYFNQAKKKFTFKNVASVARYKAIHLLLKLKYFVFSQKILRKYILVIVKNHPSLLSLFHRITLHAQPKATIKIDENDYYINVKREIEKHKEVNIKCQKKGI